METTTGSGQLRIVVLKWDRLYGDMIRRTIWEVWENADVKVFQLGFGALACIDERMPDMFVTGIKVADMDGLEHLEHFTDGSLPILIVTSRPDSRSFEMLRNVHYDGLLDGRFEDGDRLASVLPKVLQRELYVSPSLIPFLKAPKSITLDALTSMEKVVLSVIGDGSDNLQASTRLGMSPETVGSHRKRIMAKLGLHHKGEIVHYALAHGYVLITGDCVWHPGFQRRLAGNVSVDHRGGRPRKGQSPSGKRATSPVT